jgi:hypothetical protein
MKGRLKMTTRVAASLTVLLLALAAMALTGCGVGDATPEEKISNTTDTYLRSLASGDTAKACAQLTSAAKNGLDAPCPQAMQKIAARVGSDALSQAADKGVDIEVEGAKSSVTVEQLNDARLDLVRTGDRWQIDSGYELDASAS